MTSPDLFLGTQSAIAAAREQRSYPTRQINYPIEGTVVAVYFPKDTNNVSKREIEYDVMPDFANFGTIKNAPLALGIKGIVDADEILLKPAQLIISSGLAYIKGTSGIACDTDGDRVLVQFVNGSFFNPVITHVLNSRQRNHNPVPPKYTGKLELLETGPSSPSPVPGYTFGTGSAGSTAADLTCRPGERFEHQKMNGTHVAVDENGDVFINFKEHPDALKGILAGAVTKKLVIQNEGQDLVRIEKDATGKSIVTLCQAATSLLVKVGAGAKSVALADYLETLYTTAVTGIKAVYDVHTHSTAVGPSGPPLAPAATFPAWDTKIKSTKVKIPDEP